MSDQKFIRHFSLRIRGFYLPLILYFILLSNLIIHAQVKFDYNWQLSDYIRVIFNNNYPLVVQEYTDSPYTYGIFNTAISDTLGNYLFFTNGTELFDQNYQFIANGDSLNPSFYDIGVGPGTVLPQGLIIIPYPKYNDKYIIFTLDCQLVFPSGSPYFFLAPQNLLFHVVDMSLNNGLGEVVSKRQVAIHDTLSRGYIHVNKHANGRDWWVVVPIWNSNCYYTFLVDPEGVHDPIRQCLGIHFGDKDALGSVDFSPDGRFYARTDVEYGVEIMEFDRCSGMFENPMVFDFPDPDPWAGGIGFSPNSQYVYVSTKYRLWQYDLESEEVESSLVLAGEVPEEYHGQPGTGYLYLQQIGPDGKIYIAGNYNHYYMSVIEKPDQKGMDCEFNPYGFFLTTGGGNYAGIPNHPNYRLGPIDGSGCDTLGIDNVPKAYFRYDTSETDPLHFEFTDLSYFGPAMWSWDFDDGNQTTEKNPSHTFESAGMYEVCLEVSNVNGSDVFCRTLDLMTTGLENVIRDNNLILYPNPTSGKFYIQIKGDMQLDKLMISDITGNTVQVVKYTQEPYTEISLADLPAGIYFVRCMRKDKLVKTFRVAKF